MYNFQKKKEEKYSDGKHLRNVMSCKNVYNIILYYVPTYHTVRVRSE